MIDRENDGRLEQALAARFDQVECLLVVARRAALAVLKDKLAHEWRQRAP
jgi:hypothetical protein